MSNGPPLGSSDLLQNIELGSSGPYDAGEFQSMLDGGGASAIHP